MFGKENIILDKMNVLKMNVEIKNLYNIVNLLR